MNCLNSNFEVEELTTSQRQAVITLIAKPGIDITSLKSWRPISLLNVDLKIQSSILVAHIKGPLQKIIHKDQTAFLPNRYIGEPIRIIHDNLDFTNKLNEQSILFAADFQAAFDSTD